MTRRLSVEWPDAAPFRDRNGSPIRILAVSDQLDPALVNERNRSQLGKLDVIVGCGDLDCDHLSFLADAFNAPLLYVHGNHDTDRRWQSARNTCPAVTPTAEIQKEAGISIAGLSWPGHRDPGAVRSESAAWGQAVSLVMHRIGHSEPILIFSHVPPRDLGDVATDAYHRGFSGYKWLLNRTSPPLWLHGHTPLAATGTWHIRHQRTTLVNVTGAVVIEICPPGSLGPWKGEDGSSGGTSAASS